MPTELKPQTGDKLMEQFIRDTHAWQERVMGQLAQLNARYESIDDHFARLNGSVARHEVAINRLERKGTARDSAEKTSEKINARWRKALWPLLGLALGALAKLLLLNGPSIAAK